MFCGYVSITNISRCYNSYVIFRSSFPGRSMRNLSTSFARHRSIKNKASTNFFLSDLEDSAMLSSSSTSTRSDLQDRIQYVSRQLQNALDAARLVPVYAQRAYEETEPVSRQPKITYIKRCQVSARDLIIKAVHMHDELFETIKHRDDIHDKQNILDNLQLKLADCLLEQDKLDVIFEKSS